jgi:glycosyltransferase involved in cell wall biosynthesis
LLPGLDAALVEHGLEANVLIVDDSSTELPEEGFPGQGFRALRRIDILPLRRNLGHQRAIAVGLAYVQDRVPCPAVVVMDSDGEDHPRDVPRLIERYRQEGGRKIVFAERTRRSESWVFRIFYFLYRVSHRLLTGYGVRVGNFSIVPRPLLSRLVTVSEMWNHYAAAVFKSRQPFVTIPTRRARRLEGEPRMNFVNLVVHGLSAISVYGELVGVRLLAATMALTAAAVAGLGWIIGLRLLSDAPVPGWAMFAVGMLLAVLLQGVLFLFLILALILGSRQGAMFLPLRDYGFFIEEVRTVYPRP